MHPRASPLTACRTPTASGTWRSTPPNIRPRASLGSCCIRMLKWMCRQPRGQGDCSDKAEHRPAKGLSRPPCLNSLRRGSGRGVPRGGRQSRDSDDQETGGRQCTSDIDGGHQRDHRCHVLRQHAGLGHQACEPWPGQANGLQSCASPMMQAWDPKSATADRLVSCTFLWAILNNLASSSLV